MTQLKTTSSSILREKARRRSAEHGVLSKATSKEVSSLSPSKNSLKLDQDITARVRSFPTLALASMLKEDRKQEQQRNAKDTNSVRTSTTRSILLGGEEVEVSVLTPECQKVKLKAFEATKDDSSSAFPRCKSDPSFKNKRQAKSNGKMSCSSGSGTSRRRRSPSTSKRSSRRSSNSSSLLDSSKESDRSMHGSRRGSYGSLWDSSKESDKSSRSARRSSHGSLYDTSRIPEKSSRSTKRVSYNSLRDSLKESDKSSRRRGSHGSLMGHSLKATGKSCHDTSTRKNYYFSKQNQELHDSCPMVRSDDYDSEDEADEALVPFLSKPGLFSASEHSRRASSCRSSRTTATTLLSSSIRASPSNRLLATAVIDKGHNALGSRAYGRGTSFESSAAGKQRNATFTKSDEKKDKPALHQGLDTIGSTCDHHYFQLTAAERREERSRRRCRTCHDTTRRASLPVASANYVPSMDRSRRRRGTTGHATLVMSLTAKPVEESSFADFDHVDDKDDCHGCQEHHHGEGPEFDDHMEVWEKRAARRHACSSLSGETRSQRKQRSSIISPQA